MLTLHQAIFLNLTCAASLFLSHVLSANQRYTTNVFPSMSFLSLSYHIYLTGMEHLRAAANTIALHIVAALINNDNPPYFFSSYEKKHGHLSIRPP